MRISVINVERKKINVNEEDAANGGQIKLENKETPNITIDSITSYGGEIKLQNQQATKIRIINGIYGEEYKGSYNVIPQVAEQTLETKDKVLKDNVTIQPIPFYEVDNLQDGQTIIIGGNLKWQ